MQWKRGEITETVAGERHVKSGGFRWRVNGRHRAMKKIHTNFRGAIKRCGGGETADRAQYTCST